LRPTRRCSPAAGQARLLQQHSRHAEPYPRRRQDLATRFRGGTAPSTALDAVLFDDFDAFSVAREKEDCAIKEFFGTIDGRFLDGDIHYRNNEGGDLSDPTALLTAHFFNHQTHHRGQVHDMLSQTGLETPVLDMHRTIRP